MLSARPSEDGERGTSRMFAALTSLMGESLDAARDAAQGRFMERVGKILGAVEHIAETTESTEEEVLEDMEELLANGDQDPGEAIGTVEKYVERTKELEVKMTEMKDAERRFDKERAETSISLEGAKKEVEEGGKKIAELELALKQAQQGQELAERAAGDILRIKETVLAQLQGTAAAIENAVKSSREASGVGLAAYVTIKDIDAVNDACLKVFQQLRTNILKNISLFAVSIEKYQSVLEKVAASRGIPSMKLFGEVNECLGALNALLELQTQLISDQVDDASADNAGRWEEAPNDWIDKESGKLIDFYTILTCGYDDTSDEIRSAYKKCAMHSHPDRNEGAEDYTFKLVVLAFSVLFNEESRKKYNTLYSLTQ